MQDVGAAGFQRLEAITVGYTGSSFYVVDGHRRLSAALRNEFRLIPGTLAAEREALKDTMLVRGVLEEQFEDLDQQHHSGVLGMWVFLATEVMFFGAPTRFPASPAILAQRCGAPIMVVHTFVDGDKRIQSSVEPPIYEPRSLPREQAAQQPMQTVAFHMGNFFRLHPDQWYVFRAMWPKQSPVGGLSLRTRLRGAFGWGAES